MSPHMQYRNIEIEKIQKQKIEKKGKRQKKSQL